MVIFMCLSCALSGMTSLAFLAFMMERLRRALDGFFGRIVAVSTLILNVDVPSAFRWV